MEIKVNLKTKFLSCLYYRILCIFIQCTTNKLDPKSTRPFRNEYINFVISGYIQTLNFSLMTLF